jgi:hypothetical protein
MIFLSKDYYIFFRRKIKGIDKKNIILTKKAKHFIPISCRKYYVWE